ncbi:hypothetical protein KAR91_83430 [Candidatus Pacearchaeota archaeon]|nr:hypothetical protein [Candidatus Pacearchaeota archaeon]
MEISLTVSGLEKTLYIIPEHRAEADRLEDLAKLGEPLVAVIKKSAGYRHPHLEVRKESHE